MRLDRNTKRNFWCNEQWRFLSYPPSTGGNEECIRERLGEARGGRHYCLPYLLSITRLAQDKTRRPQDRKVTKIPDTYLWNIEHGYWRKTSAINWNGGHTLCAQLFSLKWFPFFSKVWWIEGHQLIEGGFEWRIPLLSPAAPPPVSASTLPATESGGSDNGQVTVIPRTSPSPPPDYWTLSQTLAQHRRRRGECIHDEA